MLTINHYLYSQVHFLYTCKQLICEVKKKKQKKQKQKKKQTNKTKQTNKQTNKTEQCRETEKKYMYLGDCTKIDQNRYFSLVEY